MKCPTCNSDNPSRAMFCDNCGTALQVARSEPGVEAPAATGIVCPQCSTPAVAGQIYCDNCGAELAQAEKLEIPGFEILGEIGRGGMSVTYCARHKGDEKLFAIKVMDAELRYILEHEAKVLSVLKHPNIVRLHPLEEDGQQFVGQIEWQGQKNCYIVLDYLEGGSLTNYLGIYRPLPLKRTIEILDQVGSAVDYAHTQNILHLDLKPSNILLSKDGRRAVVSDFGIALALVEHKEEAAKLLGTPLYMSPEHCAGREVDERADIYSLGVILAEMLSSQPLREMAPTPTMETSTPVRVSDESGPYEIPEEMVAQLPDGVRAIVLKALSKDKTERYPNAKALVADLRRAWIRIRCRKLLVRAARVGGIGLGVAFLLFDLLYLIQLVTGGLYRHGETLVSLSLGFIKSLPFWLQAVLGALNVIIVLLAVVLYKVENFEDEVEDIGEKAELLSSDKRKPLHLIGRFGVKLLSMLVELYRSDKRIAEISSTAVLKLMALFYRVFNRERMLTPRPRVYTTPPPTSRWRLGYVPTYVAPAMVPMPTVPPPPAPAPAPPAPMSDTRAIVLPIPIAVKVPPLAKLKTITGGEEKEFAIIEGRRTIIGRDPQECNVIIEDPEVSRKHAAIEATEEGFSLTDLGSTYGTLIAPFGVITGKYQLKDEDIIVLGKSVLFFHWESAKVVEYLAKKLGMPAPELITVQPAYHMFTLDATVEFANTALPSKIPVVIWGQRDFEKDGINELRSALEELKVRVVFLILFAGEEHIKQTQRLLDTAIRRTYAYDVIVLGQLDIYHLTSAQDPQAELRRLVLSHVDLITVSPYVIHGPVPDTMFFGRERELREITEHASSSSYALIGGRLIGKTSILWRLHRVRLPAAGFRILYHDCSITPMREKFLKAKIESSYWRPDSPLHVPPTFGDLIESPPDDRPLVLLLDEVDALMSANKEDNWLLFNSLRSLASGHRCQFVVAGSRVLREAMRDASSPLYNFANEILIGNLDYASVEELVTHPMKQLNIELADEPEIVRNIYAITFGHPNLVQRLCRRLIERLNERQCRRIEVEDIEAIVNTPRFLRDDLLNILWEQATPLERVISLLMVQQPECRSFEAVRQALARIDLQPSARQVRDALERLVVLRSMLKYTADGYDFVMTSFPDIVAGATTLAEELTDWREEYHRRGEN